MRVELKKGCDNIVCKWQMTFQASEYKGNFFLDLNNDNNQPICIRVAKLGLKFFLNIFFFYFLNLVLGF